MSEPISDPGPIYATAQAVLETVVIEFTGAGIDLPARQVLVPGLHPAYDCPQLTVAVQNIRLGLLGEQDDRPMPACPSLRYARFRVELVRCTPTQRTRSAPTPEALDVSTREVLRDLHTLQRALTGGRAFIAGAGQVAAGRGVPVYIGNITPLGPEGGLVGCQADIDVPV